eukprot:scaffold95079_cov17-Tisochrysis_lutea.AAC.1
MGGLQDVLFMRRQGTYLDGRLTGSTSVWLRLVCLLLVRLAVPVSADNSVFPQCRLVGVQHMISTLWR